MTKAAELPHETRRSSLLLRIGAGLAVLAAVAELVANSRLSTVEDSYLVAVRIAGGFGSDVPGRMHSDLHFKVIFCLFAAVAMTALSVLIRFPIRPIKVVLFCATVVSTIMLVWATFNDPSTIRSADINTPQRILDLEAGLISRWFAVVHDLSLFLAAASMIAAVVVVSREQARDFYLSGNADDFEDPRWTAAFKKRD